MIPGRRLFAAFLVGSICVAGIEKSSALITKSLFSNALSLTHNPSLPVVTQGQEAAKFSLPRVWKPAHVKSLFQTPKNMENYASNFGKSLDESRYNPRKLERSSSLTSTLNNNRLALASIAILALASVWTSFPAISNALTSPVAVVAATGGQANLLVQKLGETGFYQAFSLVFLSEIGDKTFFIAGLLAMKTSKFVSYMGSMAALILMTIISVLIGQIFHAVPNSLTQGIPLDDYAAVAAFTFFGLKTLKDAFDEDNVGVMEEELEEAEEVVEGSEALKVATKWAQILSTLGLVFAAEFGDRSFLSTIALSAAQNPISVAGGAIAAHGLATGIAVSGGAVLAKYISEKVIGIVSGVLFLVFAATTALGIF